MRPFIGSTTHALARFCDRHFFAVVDKRNLAVDRIVLCAFTLVYFSFYRPVDFTAYAEIPESFRQVPALPRALGFTVGSKPMLAFLQGAWTVSMLAACIGIATRASLVVATAAFAYLVTLTNSFGHARIGHPLLLFALALMCTTRCGDALCLERVLFARRRVEPNAPPQLAWPRLLIFALPVLTFWGAGIEKVHTSGFAWGWSDTLEHTVRAGRWEFALSDLQDGVGAFAITRAPLRLLGAFALALELSAPLSFFRKFRPFMIVAYGSFIITIWLMIAEPMFEFLILLLFGIDWVAAGRVASGKLQRS